MITLISDDEKKFPICRVKHNTYTKEGSSAPQIDRVTI